MIDDKHLPATKRDVSLIIDQKMAQMMTQMMDQIGTYYDNVYQANERWKEEIIHEFHIVKEDMRHDYLGTHKDRIENHENRLKRVETHLHLSSL
jgi:hypothetical protein